MFSCGPEENLSFPLFLGQLQVDWALKRIRRCFSGNKKPLDLNFVAKLTFDKGYKFISSRKQEKCTKANCMTTEAHFLEKMKKLDFKQCAERQYQQTLVAKNLCWVNRFFTCWLKILNYVLESLQFLSKYNWLLTNHADIALDVSHTKTNKHVSWFLFQTPH